MIPLFHVHSKELQLANKKDDILKFKVLPGSGWVRCTRKVEQMHGMPGQHSLIFPKTVWVPLHPLLSVTLCWYYEYMLSAAIGSIWRDHIPISKKYTWTCSPASYQWTTLNQLWTKTSDCENTIVLNIMNEEFQINLPTVWDCVFRLENF